MNNQKQLNALLRQDLSSFIHKAFMTVASGEEYLPNWHIEAIAYHLECCFRGDMKRLIITMPPRYLKSISASVAFPAWVLGHDPSRKIICASYAQSLAEKLSLDTRTIMESDWYRPCFPAAWLDNKKNTQAEFTTSKQGFRLATSVGGSLTGRGGNLIIIDDPHKADEVNSDTKREAVITWFRNTLLSRLDNKQKDVIIVIQQRLHENDLAGYLLETGQWTHLNLAAIAEQDENILIGDNHYHLRKQGDVLHPERESLELLEQMKSTMGSQNFAAQYQQRPTPAGGDIVKLEWFKTYDKKPQQRSGDHIVQSWDTACKAGELNDWSVCTTWLIQDNRFYLLDVVRERLEYPALRSRIVASAEQWQTDIVLIEAMNAGLSLIQELRANTSLNIVPITPKDDKATRMMAESPAIESGRVLIPSEAVWLADFQHEMVHFPNSKHDDQVDSLSQFLCWAKKRENKPPQVSITVFTQEPSLSVNDLFSSSAW